MKRLVSWNVNGIRACTNKGLIEWIKKDKSDIYCFQETKANLDQFPKEVTELKNYKLYTHSAQKKGYSGVAVLTKVEPKKVITQIGIEKFDIEGRVLILEFEEYVLFNCYYPNGQRDHGRVDYKLEFYSEILKLIKKYQRKNIPVIATGDFNTAHHPIDLANPKTNKNTTGFLEHERVWIDKFLNAGLIDTVRDSNPETEGLYTWWTYRGDCRQRNIGWRIDYFFISKDLKFKEVKHLPEIMGSDHCPIKLTLS